jgi:hypothetical protein
LSERRHPPSLTPPGPIHVGSGEIDKQELARWTEDVSRILKKLCRHQTAAFDSLPAPHGSTHDVDDDDPLTTPSAPTTVVSDAGTASVGDGPSYMREDAQLVVQTATPTSATGTAHAQGSSQSLMRADATIKQGIVTTKGDLLGFSTVPARVPIGADHTTWVAKASETLGGWYRTAAQFLATLLTTAGDLAVHNGTTVVRFPVGTFPQVLISGGGTPEAMKWADPWQAFLCVTPLTDNTVTDIFTAGISPTWASYVRAKFTIRATDGTEVQYRSGVVTMSGYNKSGTITLFSATPTEYDVENLNSAGTLTVTWSTNISGNNVTLRVNANSSFATPTISAAFQFLVVDEFESVTLAFTP